MSGEVEHLARTIAVEAHDGQVWTPNAQWQALMAAQSGPLAFTRGYMARLDDTTRARLTVKYERAREALTEGER